MSRCYASRLAAILRRTAIAIPLPMPDIVPNLLHLSSEVADLADLFEPALDIVTDGRPTPMPPRSSRPRRPIGPSKPSAASADRQVPLDLAADALERERRRHRRTLVGRAACSGRRRSAVARRRNACCSRAATSRETALADAASALSDAIAIVEQRERAAEQLERLQTILAITQDWQQTNEMETLLVRMAEAATRLFDADRASIFLWDKPNKTIVGRPALGVEGGELRMPDDAGIVGQVIQTGEPRRVNDMRDADEIDRAVDRRPAIARTRFSACRSFRRAANGSARSKCSTSATARSRPTTSAA